MNGPSSTGEASGGSLLDAMHRSRSLDAESLLAPALGATAFAFAWIAQPALPFDAAIAPFARFEQLFGIEAVLFAKIVVTLAFGGAVGALADIARAAAGTALGAGTATTMALLWTPFRGAMLADPGTGMAVALSLVALAFALRGSSGTAGILFGLSVIASPSGLAALAGPVVASFWMVRRLPRTLLARAAISAVVGGLLWWFASGSPPWSSSFGADPFEAELCAGELGGDSGWIFGLVLLALAATRIASIERRDVISEIAATALAVGGGLDLVGRLLVGSLSTSGAASLAPPLVVLAAAAPAALARAGRAGSVRHARVAAAVVVLALVVGVADLLLPDDRTESAKRRAAFDLDRLSAGRWLAKNAADEETIESRSGWVRVGAQRDSTLSGSGQADYVVLWQVREEEEIDEPVLPPDYVPLALFDSGWRHFDDLPWVTVFGRRGSRVASTGLRAFTLRDLGEYALIPGVPAPKAVEWRGADLFEHPSGGVRFLVPSEGRRFSIRFQPTFAPEAQREKSDGITFELRAGGLTRFRTFLYGTDPELEHLVRVVDGVAGKQATLDLLVGVGPAQNGRNDWALWRGLRIYVEGGDPSKLLRRLSAADPDVPPDGKPRDATRSNEEELVQ